MNNIYQLGLGFPPARKSGKLPDTSLASFRQAKKGLIESHHAKIIQALEVLGKANYERIGEYLKIDKIAIARRLSELERDGKIFKPGAKAKTKSGYNAYEYTLK